ncbi:MAG: SDR family NAD(P)-dependent oxidoreductase, partial [Proteobacteria bacterium]|nr:SDR family NAD(P)-dependent oxidoreductase [Pseudomonadota bacterium]
LEGSYQAFARIPPVAQPTVDEIARLVAKDSFRGAVCLVVGGSRGLGEVTAKACAAGGARVLITYAAGQAEAQAVADEIRAFGGVCDLAALDVRGDIASQLSALPARPTHLYYYATGPIAQRRSRLFSAEVLDDFLQFYATAFEQICELLATAPPAARLRAFYPSSVAVDDAPKGWAQYAMAKAAGEILCRQIDRDMAGVEVQVLRLPRILTDQTATVRAAAAEPVLDVILPIVRKLQGA